jgi:hypothetical protein
MNKLSLNENKGAPNKNLQIYANQSSYREDKKFNNKRVSSQPLAENKIKNPQLVNLNYRQKISSSIVNNNGNENDVHKSRQVPIKSC